MNIEKSRVLCDVPRRGVFCGTGRYLRIQEMSIRERMFPILEDDSYLLVINEGSGMFIINGVAFEVNKGDVCWIQCSQVLTIEVPAARTLKLWVCVFDYQLFNYLMFRIPLQSAKASIVFGTPVIRSKGEYTQKILCLFREFKNIDKCRDYGTSLIKVSLLGQIAVLFSKESQKCGEKYMSQKWPVGWRSCAYIAAHSTEPLKIAAVADELDTDSLVLNRELRMITGMNFDQILSRNRIILAASYFLYENLPFDYIAAHSGFKSEITFYRNFKKTMGVNPQEYREQILSKGYGCEVYRGMIMDETLVSVINYLYNNVTEQISLDSMAKALYTSGSIIRSLLYKAFGVGYKEILSVFRIRYSESLLATTELPIVDISAMVGFYSSRTFSRIFSLINGMSPSDYRRMCRNRREDIGK